MAPEEKLEQHVSREASVAESPSEPEPADFSEPADHERIAALAYELWQARGCPSGTPEEDWFRAEKELRVRCKAAAAGA